ncbi:MAG: hypothetical protein L3J03_02090 [Desulfobacterales bacterium]|nr:hypothetical protein [Desulfobacterales bacterium]
MKTLAEQTAEIRLLMEYGVPGQHRDAAIELLTRHGEDSIALNLFQEFYSFLPEAREDAITVLRLLARRQGIFLICATTLVADYLYTVGGQGATFLGPLAEGIWEKEVLDFFGFKDREESVAAHRELDRFPVYVPVHLNDQLCHFCAVSSGEEHVFGCPAEICPWCGGQLIGCNCRFEQLERDRLEREKQINTLHAMVNEKGRVPFEPGQGPAYPAMDEDE